MIRLLLLPLTKNFLLGRADQKPEISRKIASTTVCGSAERMISPMTAIPCAPADRQRRAFSAVMPPSATTGPEVLLTTFARLSTPSAGQ